MKKLFTTLWMVFILSVLLVAQCGPTPFLPMYASTSFWRQQLPSNPTLASNSAAIVQTAFTSVATPNCPLCGSFVNSHTWAQPPIFNHPTDQLYTVTCTLFCSVASVQFRIPAGAQPATGSDGHLGVIDQTLKQELDMWQAVYNSTNNTWSASTVLVNSTVGWGAACAQGQHCNSAVASGFALFGGAVWPDEIRAGVIQHALSMTTPNTLPNVIACPATHTDGQDGANGIPEGAHIFLDPSVNINSFGWPSWFVIIAKALQTYGAYISDTSGGPSIRGVDDTNLGTDTWASVGVSNQSPLTPSNFPWSSLRVIQWSTC